MVVLDDEAVSWRTCHGNEKCCDDVGSFGSAGSFIRYWIFCARIFWVASPPVPAASHDTQDRRCIPQDGVESSLDPKYVAFLDATRATWSTQPPQIHVSNHVRKSYKIHVPKDMTSHVRNSMTREPAACNCTRIGYQRFRVSGWDRTCDEVRIFGRRRRWSHFFLWDAIRPTQRLFRDHHES